MSETTKVPYLKADAIVEIKIGSGYAHMLTNTLTYLLEGKKEETEALAKRVHESDLNPWENAVITITNLIQEIAKVAGETGQLDYKELDEMLPIPNED